MHDPCSSTGARDHGPVSTARHAQI